MESAIELRDVTVTYGRTVAIDRLGADISYGITGLFGPNGSGKSTLLRVLSGLLRPASGSVTAFGRPLTSRDENLRGRIGYAGHTSGLYGRLTVVENLTLFGRLHGIEPARVDVVVDQLGLQERARTPARELSAGFRRRAAVARAVLHEPELLLLDEPYANLDDEAAELVSNAIRAWTGPRRAAVIATHGAKKVKAYADAGLIMQRGRLIRQGTYETTGFTT